MEAAACFPELLRWVLAWWTPSQGDSGTDPPLVLVLNPTHPRDEWVALMAVAYGTRHEQARRRDLPPGRLRSPPAVPDPQDGPPRRFRVLRQGAACLRRLLARNRLWARVWLTPTPGPDAPAACVVCRLKPAPAVRQLAILLRGRTTPRPDRPCPQAARTGVPQVRDRLTLTVQLETVIRGSARAGAAVPVHAVGVVMGLRQTLLFFLLPVCALASLVLLTSCSTQQVGGGLLEAAILADPDDAHGCLHGENDKSAGNHEGTCWVLVHWRYAQHFCRLALEAEVPKPFRWEEQPVDDPLFKTLFEAVPGSDLVIREGTPAFHSYIWSGPELGHMTFFGAYDLQSRTGINTWTPWEYTCAYDTFRYQVVDVWVGPVPDQ